MGDCDFDDLCITCLDICFRACRLCEACSICCSCKCMKIFCAVFSIVVLLSTIALMLVLGIGLSSTASIPLADANCEDLCGTVYSNYDTQTCCLDSTASNCKQKEICKEEM